MRATEYVAPGIFDENFLASRREAQGRGYRGRGFIPSITGIGIDGGREIYVLTVLLERNIIIGGDGRSCVGKFEEFLGWINNFDQQFRYSLVCLSKVEW